MKLFFYLIFLIFASPDIRAAADSREMDTSENRKKVVLTYSHDFSGQDYWNTPIPADCFFVFKSSPAAFFVFKPVLRCTEHLSLLRPETLIMHWQQEQKRHDFFLFNLSDTGTHYVHAKIKSILPYAFPSLKNNLISKKNSTVTGLFKRHSSDVRTYTFKKLSTGELSTINATPTHPFYIKYLNKWLPLGKITSDMTLIDSQNNEITLVCHREKQHCGIPWHPGKITTIYNLEVYKKHDYFAGEQMLLVHNCNKASPGPSVTTEAGTAGKSNIDTLQQMLLPRLAEPSKPFFISTSDNNITSVLKNESRTQYSSESDFFRAVNAGVSRHNDQMRDNGLLFLMIDLDVEQVGSGRAASSAYYNLKFSLGGAPDDFVEVPFMHKSHKVLSKSGYHFIDVGDKIFASFYGDITMFETAHVGLVDCKPSDPLGTSRIKPGFLSPLFANIKNLQVSQYEVAQFAYLRFIGL